MPDFNTMVDIGEALILSASPRINYYCLFLIFLKFSALGLLQDIRNNLHS